MEYSFRKIEQHWQQWWKDNEVYKVWNPEPGEKNQRPKCYVLDMFPYPSGAGLHVGHPLGYIASDIYARYKRLKGFNVLHPMGYDAFGLPAEQYAIEHGIHPAVSTENNINNFRRQLDNIGFSYDWDREVRTCDPKYYKWTQWIFLKFFKSFYNRKTNKAEPISNLVASFEKEGNAVHPFPSAADWLPNKFSSVDWKNFDEKTQQDILMQYRLAYCGIGEVNWCEALGTVLANDEVVNGVSERGGYPVVKKKLRQWYLRITEYADRLLEGLEKVEFSESMKEMQSNWIGKSEGAEIEFGVGSADDKYRHADRKSRHQEQGVRLKVYTTRPDTIFGVDFLVIAPEHELVAEITTAQQKQEVEDYIKYVNSRSERERMAEKKITGVFTGSYALHPFSGREIPIWISEYVLAGYGTGAIMAVPCGDERDHGFAKHFTIPITNIIGSHYNGEEANPTYEATLENSDFLNGILMKDAIEVVINKLEEMGMGERKVNYKMRDAAFSRQRYWGEPFPIVWKDGIAYPLDENDLPLELPHMEEIKPGKDGEGPLSNLREWYLIPDPSPQAEKGKVGVIPDSSSQEEKEKSGDSSALSPQVEKGKVGAANVPKYKVRTPVQYELARMMRKDYTKAEKEMWELLRNSKLGVKFRRQHPIESYIVDFVSLQNKLVVEIDGGYHETIEQKVYDAERTNVLKDIGFDVIRFTNNEVLENPYKVRDKIKEILKERIPSPPVERGLGLRREASTMPGYAGSSWYFLRYMDPHNEKEFCSRKASDYWNQVDLYIGGTEHAVGHLLYSRMWTKVLYDLRLIGFDEPFKKLVNQGMITGRSFFFQLKMIDDPNPAKAKSVITSYAKESSSVRFFRFRYGHKLVDSQGRLTRNDFIKAVQEGVVEHPPYEIEWAPDDSIFLKEESEKMSKSKFNVDNPDDIIDKYGADTFRMYEMFLGPIEQSKPWDTKGIEGVHRFLKKFWRLFYDETKGLIVTDEQPLPAELKVLHKTIRKIEEDTERFSFNTAVSAFMICVNELTELKCHKKEILEPLLVLLAPYAPHIAEELWHALGHKESVVFAEFPKWDGKYLAETSKEYPVSVNGKLRTSINISLDATQDEVEKIVLANEVVKKWMDGKQPKKIIYVKGRMINVVL
jgi:leucyl-tRNA synthetase/very-short-patch-repair endonuclease